MYDVKCGATSLGSSTDDSTMKQPHYEESWRPGIQGLWSPGYPLVVWNR